MPRKKKEKKRPAIYTEHNRPVWVRLIIEKQEDLFPWKEYRGQGSIRMALKLGCSIATYHGWLNGSRKPGRLYIVPLANLLGVSVERLLVLLAEGEFVRPTDEGGYGILPSGPATEQRVGVFLDNATGKPDVR